MEKEEIQNLYQELKQIQQRIEYAKQGESHIEQKRLLKLIDAELLDAIHNMENLIYFTK